MADTGRAPAGRPMTWVWMVLALVVVGGFLTWLGMASEPSTVAVIDENGDARNGGPDDTGLVTVERDTLAANVGRFLDQRVRVLGVEATGRLGPGIFWGELGDPGRQVPILVRMDEAVAGVVEIQQGVEYTITGQVHQVTDDLVERWAGQDEFTGEGEQLQATFADYYIQASAVRPTGGARGQPSR
jgi:hypothetical protein